MVPRDSVGIPYSRGEPMDIQTGLTAALGILLTKGLLENLVIPCRLHGKPMDSTKGCLEILEIPQRNS